jgi:hypothetical protein
VKQYVQNPAGRWRVSKGAFLDPSLRVPLGCPAETTGYLCATSRIRRFIVAVRPRAA